MQISKINDVNYLSFSITQYELSNQLEKLTDYHDNNVRISINVRCRRYSSLDTSPIPKIIFNSKNTIPTSQYLIKKGSIRKIISSNPINNIISRTPKNSQID